MKFYSKYAGILALCILNGCGGSDGSYSSDNADLRESQVSIGFSDFPVKGAESVVITVGAIVFIASGGNEIRVDTFSSRDMNLSEADTFQFDLLEVQGNDFKLVLDEVTLPVGEYSELRVEVIDENTELSYVEELGTGAIRELKIPSDELKLGGFSVEARSTQTFIVEFDLSQAMTYNPGPQRYILKPRGIRIVGLDLASIVMGNVDTIAIAAGEESCQIGSGIMYLYPGSDLASAILIDNIDSSIEIDFPQDSVSPYASAAVSETGDYLFSFVEPGSYTLTYTCADFDDPEQYDQINVPFPLTEITELSLGADDQFVCNFPLLGGNCAN